MSSYDQKLLGEAPKATRAQLQEGYNVDLLEQPVPKRTLSVRNPPASQSQPVVVPLTPPDISSGEKLGPARPYTPAAKSQTSFWRTRNGIVAIVLIVVVVVGAIIGGAVGGTVNKASKNPGGTTGTIPGDQSGTTSAPPAVSSSPSTSSGGQNSGGQVNGH